MAETEKPWDVRILELIDSGVDGTLIAENLKLTPAERLRKMQRSLNLIEEARAARGLRPPPTR